MKAQLLSSKKRMKCDHHPFENHVLALCFVVALIHGFNLLELSALVCFDTPTSRATSSTFRPASTCFSAPIICASVCLLLDIHFSPFFRKNHTQFCAERRDQVNPKCLSPYTFRRRGDLICKRKRNFVFVFRHTATLCDGDDVEYTVSERLLES